MASQLPQQGEGQAVPTDFSPARLAVLARVAVDTGASRAEVARDLAPFAPRSSIDIEIAALSAAGLCAEARGRVVATDAGRVLVAGQLGVRSVPKLWADVRDIRLVAKALGIEATSGSRIKALDRPDALRAEIVSLAFGLKHRAAATPSRLRAELAVVALERAFGHRIRGGLGAGAGSGFAPKAGRMLACQLLEKPKDPGTDTRLVTMLAAEQAGSRSPEAGALRTAILKAWIAAGSFAPVLPRRPVLPPLHLVPRDGGAAVVKPAQPKPVAAVSDAIAAKPAVVAVPTPLAPARPPAANRPDLAGFVREVQRAAAERAQGWPGNRKALVVHVFEIISGRYPDWGLTEIEFKAMLAEAHRTGHLALSTSDLRDKTQVREIAASAITYKNTVWHLVRVAE